MGIFSGLSRFERRLMAACFLLTLICIGFLLSEDFDRFLSRGKFDPKAGIQIGRITQSRNDVRRKIDGDLQWRDIERKQKIYIGDSVFAGADSTAVIQVDGKNEVQLAPNSMIRFTEIQGFKVGNLTQGTFRVQVDGEIKVAIGGELRTFQGNNSEVEVVVKKAGAKPVLKITRGDVQMKEIPPEPVTKVAKANWVPVPEGDASEVLHIWKMSELYQENADQILPKEPSAEVSVDFVLRWEGMEQNDFNVQISALPDFSGKRMHLESKASSLGIKYAFDGENYWRVSADKMRWSRRASFQVRSRFLGQKVEARAARQEVLVLNEVPPTEVHWTSSPGITDWLVEVSRSPDFGRDRTQVQRLKEPVLRARFGTAGSYYLRARGVNAQGQLTDLSAVTEVAVQVPPRLGAPILPKHKVKIPLFNQAENFLSWMGPTEARKFRVEILNDDSLVIRKQESKTNSVQVSQLPPGEYSYRVTAYDQWMRPGVPSGTQKFEVVAPPPAPLMLTEESPALEENVPPMIAKREVSSDPEASSILKLGGPNDIKNFRYSNSQLELEGATFGLLSSEQAYQNENSPYAATMSLRAKHWFSDHWGAGAAYKTKVAAINSEGSSVSPWSLDARLSARGRAKWNWFSFLREIQLGAFVGGEMYRNSNNGLFLSRYDLVKLGANVEFPLFGALSSGGEFSYGLSSDNSHKMEISGFINYFLQKRWSVGGGYRVHLFEAGSKASSPVGLVPYREGYLEGFSTLRYSY